MPIDTSIKQLSYLQLRTVLSRLRLGLEQLRSQLSAAQLKELLQLGALPELQKEYLQSDKVERLGNFIPLLNTIFTSLLGGWLGLSGFMQFHLANALALTTVLSVAVLGGGYLGYASYQSTRRQAQQAILQQKLLHIELIVLQALRQKCQYASRMLVKQINYKLAGLNHDLAHIEPLTLEITKTQLGDWLLQLSKNLTQATLGLSQQLKDTTLQIINKLQQQLVRLTDQQPRKLRQIKSPVIRSLLEVKPTSALPRPHWLRDNALSILLVVAPTFLGGGASMFVYLCGIPDLNKAFGSSYWIPEPYKPTLKVIALILALSASVYFACSQAYANYKNYQRQREIKKSRQLIAEQEALLLKDDAWFSLLRRLRGQVERVSDIFALLQVIEREQSCLET